ncbi:hypothetical protein BB934_03560 [Microvirga ossetica]|uniref:Uncharacterized protein n=1 Tax=Microvirga ossetica TaxID=1882682 RepID=A0A1B2EBR5_9HYPH|nr:hypothetical protein BB934_03560 [Microvirga ossetica]
MRDRRDAGDAKGWRAAFGNDAIGKQIRDDGSKRSVTFGSASRHWQSEPRRSGWGQSESFSLAVTRSALWLIPDVRRFCQ